MGRPGRTFSGMQTITNKASFQVSITAQLMTSPLRESELNRCRCHGDGAVDIISTDTYGLKQQTTEIKR